MAVKRKAKFNQDRARRLKLINCRLKSDVTIDVVYLNNNEHVGSAAGGEPVAIIQKSTLLGGA